MGPGSLEAWLHGLQARLACSCFQPAASNPCTKTIKLQIVLRKGTGLCQGMQRGARASCRPGGVWHNQASFAQLQTARTTSAWPPGPWTRPATAIVNTFEMLGGGAGALLRSSAPRVCDKCGLKVSDVVEENKL
jgi:hypothetical protein